jgi:hypothetical protein
MISHMKTRTVASFLAWFLALSAPINAQSQAIVLQRVSGEVGYLTSLRAAPVPVVGQLAIEPRDYAQTQARSMAALNLPDSSIVSIGASTRVQVARFQQLGSTSIARMTIYDGAVHFSVRHPGGARANYVFVTPTSEIAIRGTEGIIVVLPGETIVACVHGTPNDTLVITKDGSRMYVPVGETVRIHSITSKHTTMSMHSGITGAQFAQFASIVAHNHAMRMRGLQK